jgi:cysteine desulfurase
MGKKTSKNMTINVGNAIKPTFPIYLDHHATTPTDIRVYKKMRPFFLRDFGNPASLSHAYGFRAQEAIDEARNLVALAIGAHPTEIIFTSGATESNNMAIKGLLMPKSSVLGNHIISSSIDHPATLATLAALSDTVAQVSLLKPTKEGIITQENLKNNLTN